MATSPSIRLQEPRSPHRADAGAAAGAAAAAAAPDATTTMYVRTCALLLAALGQAANPKHYYERTYVRTYHNSNAIHGISRMIVSRSQNLRRFRPEAPAAQGNTTKAILPSHADMPRQYYQGNASGPARERIRILQCELPRQYYHGNVRKRAHEPAHQNTQVRL